MDQPIVGIDFEWRPVFRKGGFHPISIIQMSTLDHVFVFHVTIGTGERVARESPVFTRLLTDTEGPRPMLLIKDPHGDRPMFLKSFGIELPSVTCIHGVLNGVSMGTLNVGAICKTLGLASNTPKNKRIACSDWSQWPLTRKQQLYAAFDPYFNILCCVILARVIRERGEREDTIRDRGEAEGTPNATSTSLCRQEESGALASLNAQTHGAFSYQAVVDTVRDRLSASDYEVTDALGQVIPKPLLSEYQYGRVKCGYCEAGTVGGVDTLVHMELYHPKEAEREREARQGGTCLIQMSAACLLHLPMSTEDIDRITEEKLPVVIPASNATLLRLVPEGIRLRVQGCERLSTLCRSVLVKHWRCQGVFDVIDLCLQSGFAEEAWTASITWDLTGSGYGPDERSAFESDLAEGAVSVVDPFLQSAQCPVEHFPGYLFAKRAEELAQTMKERRPIRTLKVVRHRNRK
ncbi:hypothetical protein KIPB_004747 [Kipferlia bialata]|uniref:3'-5' exonuclease domain-containing protein n=1 Tax=Kipferlia bialata TaxID=797122 RepID=A0A9K3GGS6_9EUKA|nr:hypothetical protein KIPB_004747 [Kipferlia bialata]|eukprot:g4747.t1